MLDAADKLDLQEIVEKGILFLTKGGEIPAGMPQGNLIYIFISKVDV